MKRLCLTKLFLLLTPAAVLSVPAHADIIQIGTLSDSARCTTTPPNIGCNSQYSIKNLMTDDSMTATAASNNFGGHNVLNVSIAPGATTSVLSGFYDLDETFSFSGTLSSLDFTIGGQQYEAASLNWSSPSVNASGGSAAIDITATKVDSPVPEPSSIALFAATLLGVGFVRRKSRQV